MKNEQPIRIGVLGATFETENMGVSALAAGAITSILAHYPNASIFFLDYAKQGTVRAVLAEGKIIQVPLINMRFSLRIYLQNNIVFLLLLAIALRIVPYSDFRRWIVNGNKCLYEIVHADLLASVAGGDSFSDFYGLARFFYVSLPQILVILMRKKLILLPQTFGPFNHPMMKRIARYIVDRAERTFCRDYRSLDQLMGTVQTDSQRDRRAFCYDLAFCINCASPSCLNVDGFSLTTSRKATLIGLNISGLLFNTNFTQGNPFSLRVNYRDLTYRLIDHLIDQHNGTVLLVPHVYGTEKGSESDTLVCEQVFDLLKRKYSGRLGLLRGSYDQNEIRYVIGLCGMFLGSRMHACIAAASQYVPAVAMAYSDKFIGVMETIGIEQMTIDLRRLDMEQSIAAVDLTWKDRQRVGRELERRMPLVRETVRTLFAHLEAPCDKAFDHRVKTLTIDPVDLVPRT